LSSYFPAMKKYIWVVIVCFVLVTVLGYAVDKSQKPVYQASATLYVDTTAPGTSLTANGSSSSATTDSITQSTNYSAEIMTNAVMSYVLQYDPKLKQRGFTAADLQADISATNPSATAATVLITASALHTADAVLVANDVAYGFVAYKTQELTTQLTTERNYYQNTLNQYQEQVNKLEEEILSYGNSSDPHVALYTEDRDTLETNMTSVRTTLLNLPSTVHSDATVVQIAMPSTTTLSSKGSEIVAVAAVLGLIIGLLIWLLLIYSDNRVRSEDQVPEKLGMSYLGTIAKNKQDISAGAVPTTGAVARELADIAVNLHLTGLIAGQARAPQGAVLLVTSAQAAEGKTTVATGLAAALAKSGKSALVIDGNLRNPATHLAFGVTSPAFGLSSLLRGNGSESVDSAVQRTSTPGVWFLPGGAEADDAPLLIEQRLPSVLTQLRQKTDWIIIDGPSVLSGADASILASMADGVVLVVDGGNDKLKLLLRAKAVLMTLTHTSIGVVMNRMPPRKRNAYYAVTYVEEGAYNVVPAVQGAMANGSNHGITNGQPVGQTYAISGASTPNSYGMAPARPAALPMDFPVMQPNPNPASPFPAQRRMDSIPPQM
jgi:polysaccharide biosynthesis transport protein